MKQAKSHYRVSAKALIYNKDKSKFLCVLEDCGEWSIPGGGVDHGEYYKQTLIREIKEEMGLEVIKVSKNPLFFTTYFGNNIWKANIFFEVEIKDLNFRKSDECIDIKFMEKTEIKNLKIAKDLKALLKLL